MLVVTHPEAGPAARKNESRTFAANVRAGEMKPAAVFKAHSAFRTQDAFQHNFIAKDKWGGFQDTPSFLFTV
jgi:hypothetical protein